MLSWIGHLTAPPWVFDLLHFGWLALSVLTIIATLDMVGHLVRSDHGLKP